jgi:hypothetical protein
MSADVACLARWPKAWPFAQVLVTRAIPASTTILLIQDNSIQLIHSISVHGSLSLFLTENTTRGATLGLPQI